MTTQIHQIYEDDLAVLESEMPQLMSATMTACNDPLIRKRWETVRDILTKVRWNYGPPISVKEVDAGSDGEEWKVG